MSSITQADLALGGRLQIACDFLAENKLRRAAGVLLEIGGDLNATAERETGLLAPDDEDDWSVEIPQKVNPYDTPENKAMCARLVHAWGPIYFENGDPKAPRSVCLCCGQVNVNPKDPTQPNGGGGPIDLGQYR